MYFIDPDTEQKDVSLSAYEGKSQGVTPSGIMGGIITEELRKAVMPFSASDQPVEKIAYSLASPRRFSSEDGKLERNPIDQGSVDSTVEFDLNVKANSEKTLYFWICAGRKIEEVQDIQAYLLKENPDKLMRNTINYWLSKILSNFF